MFEQKKGQNTAEYAILIALVIAAAIGIQTYVKRGIQGRLADEVDDMATRPADIPASQWIGSTKQYEPNYLDSSFTVETKSDTKNQTGTARNPTRSSGSNVERSGTETLLAP